MEITLRRDVLCAAITPLGGFNSPKAEAEVAPKQRMA